MVHELIPHLLGSGVFKTRVGKLLIFPGAGPGRPRGANNMAACGGPMPLPLRPWAAAQGPMRFPVPVPLLSKVVLMQQVCMHITRQRKGGSRKLAAVRQQMVGHAGAPNSAGFHSFIRPILSGFSEVRPTANWGQRAMRAVWQCPGQGGSVHRLVDVFTVEAIKRERGVAHAGQKLGRQRCASCLLIRHGRRQAGPRGEGMLTWIWEIACLSGTKTAGARKVKVGAAHA